MNVLTFKKQLKEHMRPYGNVEVRPFICWGNPLCCKAMIVGFNPAQSIGGDFWSYWPGADFQKDRWMNDYIAARVLQPTTKSGRSKRPLSATRERIERVLQGLDRS